jgi:crotonobetainyl-CoA:carnitine CoA-transferase CaiB-like acyl-CoA transferase
MDGERADSDLAPPALGEHTAEVLAAAGIESSELDALRAANVVG